MTPTKKRKHGQYEPNPKSVEARAALQEYFDELELTQEEFAARSPFGYWKMRRWLSGEHFPTGENMKALARWLIEQHRLPANFLESAP